MAPATQAFDDNGFTAVPGMGCTGDAPGQCPGDGTACGISLVIGGAQKRPGTSPKKGRASGFLVELMLSAGQRLTFRQIRAESGGDGAVKDRCVIGAAIGAGHQTKGQEGGKKDRFHWDYP